MKSRLFVKTLVDVALILIGLALAVFGILTIASAKAKGDRCSFLVQPVREASERYIGKKFPFWYNVAVAKVETNCRWRISADGHGSIGYFQLTPKFLDRYLRPLFPDYDKPYSRQHIEAAVYYVGMLWRSNPEWLKKLWVTYQRYNGGNWVVIECRRAKSDRWEDCYRQCRRKEVCVWRKGGKCIQWRSACEINYSYSKKVYRYGQRWSNLLCPKQRKEREREFPFW